MKHHDAADAIRKQLGTDLPADLLVLGSGLGRFGEHLDAMVRIPYAEIPHFPASTVSGHAGQLLVGQAAGRPLVCMQGRQHYYEGYSDQDIALPLRAMARLGVKRVLMTNAAGGIGEHLRPGDLMLIEDHINLTGRNPLVGPNDEALGPRFPDMSRAWDADTMARLDAAASRTGMELRRGVYVQVLGPSFETPAEIRMLAAMGADAVGMSTVPECIVAKHLGLTVAGLSLITNYAAGRVPGHTLTLEEALEEAQRAGDRLSDLLLAYYATPNSESER
jgi:purine-nucleoside phosphorylase